MTPSLGIRVLVGNPGEAPEVAITPEKWYKSIEGDSKSNIFRKVERMTGHLVEGVFFRLGSAFAEWWTKWLSMHRPRDDDGGCDAKDAAEAIAFSWPRPHRDDASAHARPNSEVANSYDAERRMADSLEYDGYGQAQHARAQAHLDEANPRTTEVVAVVRQLVVVTYTYGCDDDANKRVALGKVLSVAGTSAATRVYQCHWLVRAEALSPLNAFSVNGRYRPSRKGDWRGGVDDQSVFEATPACDTSRPRVQYPSCDAARDLQCQRTHINAASLDRNTLDRNIAAARHSNPPRALPLFLLFPSSFSMQRSIIFPVPHHAYHHDGA